jgi:hypothetical protein
VLLLCISFTVEAQGLTPPSPAIALPSAPTTPTEKFVLLTLKPLLEQALSSSEESDMTLNDLNRQIEIDKQQRIEDEKQRQSEREASAKESAGLLLRVGTLQLFFDSLSSKLTDFSGSEDEKFVRATVALDGIQARVQAVELENKLLKIGGSVLLVVAVVVAGYEGGRALRWW